MKNNQESNVVGETSITLELESIKEKIACMGDTPYQNVGKINCTKVKK